MSMVMFVSLVHLITLVLGLRVMILWLFPALWRVGSDIPEYFVKAVKAMFGAVGTADDDDVEEAHPPAAALAVIPDPPVHDPIVVAPCPHAYLTRRGSNIFYIRVKFLACHQLIGHFKRPVHALPILDVE